jgi:hypothetical protein
LTFIKLKLPLFWAYFIKKLQQASKNEQINQKANYAYNKKHNKNNKKREPFRTDKVNII